MGLQLEGREGERIPSRKLGGNGKLTTTFHFESVR